MLLLLDLSAAFDTVDHEILLGRLSSRFGIKGKTLDWLRIYLTDRTQLVKVDDASSTVRPLHWGVPRGSVLGPILYLLYTSPLGDIVREHGLSFYFYADDSQLYTSFACNDTSDPVAAKQRLENCVADINLWMTTNKLKLNNDKSEFLFLHSRFRHSLPPPTISVGMENIRPSQQAHNLGVIFLRYNVTFTIVKGAFYHIRNISKVRKYISKSTIEVLLHSFVSSKLDVCNFLLFGAQKRDIVKLQSVHNAAARIIAGLKKRDHITETLRDLHWLPVEERIVFKINLITFKTLNDSGPRYQSIKDITVIKGSFTP